MAEEDSSDLSSISSLSSAPEDDGEIEVKREKGILKFFHKLPDGAKPAEPKKEMSPPPRKRSPSPAHEYVLADNSDVAVCSGPSIALKNAKCRVIHQLIKF